MSLFRQIDTLFRPTREIHNIFLQYVLAQYSIQPNQSQQRHEVVLKSNYKFSLTIRNHHLDSGTYALEILHHTVC